ncbi:hypothetical protein F5050DRAFT_1813535 [Lentinula boryana]|uniref:Secreted protein n=1 Tax=Lentinula boryana TaxID=40481 RepID=A0ABQ8PWF3_9AGAR|nr:hypothetical protein F5050DRAFT_1813535 [Lentinula boryana]
MTVFNPRFTLLAALLTLIAISLNPSVEAAAINDRRSEVSSSASETQHKTSLSLIFQMSRLISIVDVTSSGTTARSSSKAKMPMSTFIAVMAITLKSSSKATMTISMDATTITTTITITIDHDHRRAHRSRSFRPHPRGLEAMQKRTCQATPGYIDITRDWLLWLTIRPLMSNVSTSVPPNILRNIPVEVRRQNAIP